MENIDYLSMRTTNMNIRISPLLKSSLIERAAGMGLNLSDYIMHVLTKSMSGQDKELVETKSGLKRLEKENNALQKELTKYEALANPFEKLLGQTIEMNGQPMLIENAFDILKLMSQTFKIK